MEIYKDLNNPASQEFNKLLNSQLSKINIEEGKIIEILEALIKKGETKDELAGGIFVLRDKATKVSADPNTIDTCGTGGDGQNSLNISTSAAIVLASMGVKVAKHGNKAVSSNCGSADVLEALKININLSPNKVEENIKKFIKKIPEKIFRKTGHLESRGGNLTFDAEELIKNNLNEEDKSNFDENPYLKFHSGSDLA